MNRPSMPVIGGGSRVIPIIRDDPDDNCVHPSCGCVFCDIGLEPIDGEHWVPSEGVAVPCGLLE